MTSHNEQADDPMPSQLVDQMQSEIAHLRDPLTSRDKQLDQLSHLLAMPTQQHTVLTNQLPPPRKAYPRPLEILFHDAE